MSDSTVGVYIKGYAFNFIALETVIIEYGKENDTMAGPPIPLFMLIIQKKL